MRMCEPINFPPNITVCFWKDDDGLGFGKVRIGKQFYGRCQFTTEPIWDLSYCIMKYLCIALAYQKVNNDCKEGEK